PEGRCSPGCRSRQHGRPGSRSGGSSVSPPKTPSRPSSYSCPTCFLREEQTVNGLRRYAPFALLVAAQIVLVVVAPSKGGQSANGPIGGDFNGAAPTSQQSP